MQCVYSGELEINPLHQLGLKKIEYVSKLSVDAIEKEEPTL